MTAAAALSRYADWLDWFAGRADHDPDIRCVLVNGSAVTGGFDDWSDLDVEVLCTPGESVAIYRHLLDDARGGLSVEHVWELPEQTWPDGRQCFIHCQADAGSLSQPVRIIDLHVHDLTEQSRHVDVRRDGVPHVLHDRHHLVVLEEGPGDEMAAERSAAVDQLRRRRTTASWLVNRAIARGDRAEALMFYMRFGLEPLVRLLRIRSSPARHDFGLRYLRADLPADDVERIEQLLPGGPMGLAAASRACFAWQDELLAQLP